MAQQLGGKDELTRALYSVDKKVIREYFQRGQLWSLGVSPVLLAVATLQAMLRSSPAIHCHCYSQAVQLLEYINSECPPTGLKEAEQYIDLLVEFKTKAVLYELFEEVVVTDELKEDVLTKFLGKLSLDQKEAETTYTTSKEYSELLHAYARCSLETMLSSDQMCADFRRDHLFNSENSKLINNSLQTYLSKYLSVVCEHLKQAEFPHESMREPSDTNKDIRGLTDSDTTCDEDQKNDEIASTQHVHRRSLRSRRNNQEEISDAHPTVYTTSNEEMTDTGGEQSETHRIHYNLRECKNREEDNETHNNDDEKTIPNLTDKVEENGYVFTEDSSETDVDSILPNVNFSLTPHNATSSTSDTQKASTLPASVTPTRLSVIIQPSEEDEEKEEEEMIAQSFVHEESVREESELQHNIQQTTSTIKESEETTQGRYQRQPPKSDTSAAEDTTTTLISERTVGKKHMRSASSETSDRSDITTEQESNTPLSNSRRHHNKPRSKRCSVVYHESTESSEEDILVRRDKNNRQKKDTCESSSNKNNSMQSRRKRKQITPRRLAQHTGEKLMSRVQFSRCSDDEVPTIRETRSGGLKQIRSIQNEIRSGSKPDTGIGTSNTHSRQIVPQDNDSHSECENDSALIHLLQSKKPLSNSQSAHTSCHHKDYKVVNLADSFIEQSQPNSQWDHIAVQSVAAIALPKTHPVKSSPSTSQTKSPPTRNRLRKRRKQKMSGVESEHDHVSLVTGSSEELSVLTPDNRQKRGSGDKMSVVSESSPDSSPIHTIQQTPLHSIRNLRKRS